MKSEGYEIHRNVLSSEELIELRVEAVRLVDTGEGVCIRNVLEKSEVFLKLISYKGVRSLVPDEFLCVKGILFDKTAESNWPVSWHQDLTIAVNEKVEIDGYGPWSVKEGMHHVVPPVDVLEGMITLRIHLDETSSENGCLRVVPGSHRNGKIRNNEISDYLGVEVFCECRAGDVMEMSPLILHASNRMKSGSHRRVLHLEYSRKEMLDRRLSWAHSYSKHAHVF